MFGSLILTLHLASALLPGNYEVCLYRRTVKDCRGSQILHHKKRLSACLAINCQRSHSLSGLVHWSTGVGCGEADLVWMMEPHFVCFCT